MSSVLCKTLILVFSLSWAVPAFALGLTPAPTPPVPKPVLAQATPVKRGEEPAATAKKKLQREDEILVKFRPGVSDIKRGKLHQKHGSKRLRNYKKLNLHQVKLKKGLSVEAAVKLYRADPDVEYAEPNFVVSATALPDDPYYGSTGSWGQTYRDLWGLQKLQMEQAWNIITGSPDIVVAVSDTGLDLSHPDIQGNIWTNPREGAYDGIDDDQNGFADDLHGWNFIAHNNNPADDRGHGTHVSGTIAAAANNALGVAGVAWQAKIMPLKFLDVSGSGGTADGVATIMYAADNGARVINCSWGSSAYSKALEDAINYAYGKGVVVVAAAGNSGSDAAYYYPAGYDNVLTVAATDKDDLRAGFSNYGRAVEVSAPGVEILSLRASGTDMYGGGTHIVGTQYYRANGTSMAAPHVSGLAALLFSQHPDWSAGQVMAQIVATTDDIGSDVAGSGRINALSALTMPASRVRLQYHGHSMTPLSGSNDGMLQPGTSYQMTISLQNSGAPTGATVTLLCDDPYVTLTSGGASFSSLTSWSIADNGAAPFTFTVSPDAPRLHQVTFTFAIAAGDGSASTQEVQKRVAPYVAGWPVQLGGNAFTASVTADLDGDGIPEVIVAADKVYALKGDGSTLPGWPREVPDLDIASAVAAGDLDGDGKPEVVVTTFYGAVHAFRADGSRMPGFPISVNEAGFTSVLLTDLDGDGRQEIIAHAPWSGTLYVWRHDGTLQPGWPVAIPAAGFGYLNASATVADIDNDGSPEVLVGGGANQIFALHADGTPAAGWPVVLPEFPYLLVAGDVMGDGRYKIFAATSSGSIYGLNGDGSVMPGWPQGGSAPALGDLDGDGHLDIVTDQMGCVYAYRYDGVVLPGWPQCKGSNSNFSPVLGDIDGDGGLEVVERTLTGLYAWHADGTLLAEFPIAMRAASAFTQDVPVVLGDIKGEGHPALITGSIDGDARIYAFTLPSGPAPLRLAWPMQQRDARRSGGIAAAPEIAAGGSFFAALGVGFSQQMVARNGSAPFRWEVSSGALPAGITLSGTGTLSGTPQQIGTSTFTLKVTDATGTTAVKLCTFLVQAVAIQTSELPPARLSDWYSQALVAVGGTPPYSWSVTDGTLPPGVSLDAVTGIISGYPSATGNFTPTFRVTDSLGQQGSRPLPIVASEQLLQPDGRIGGLRGIAVDAQGNTYTAEEIRDDGNFLVKTDPAGKVLWRSRLSYQYFYGLRRDSVGNLYVTSSTASNMPNQQVVTTKFDPSGTELWTRSASGSVSGMAVDGAGNLYLSGNNGASWLIKYDPSGTLAWQKEMVWEYPSALALDNAGAPYVLCAVNGLRVIIKFAASGEELRRVEVGSGYMWRPEMMIDSDDNIIMAVDSTLKKLASSGANLWSTSLNMTAPFTLATDAEKNIYLTGLTQGDDYSLHGATARYDASGRLVWSKTLQLPTTDYGLAIAVDEAGRSVYLAGATNGGMEMHPLLIRLFQPQILTSALPQATPALPFTQALAAQRGKTAYTWSILSGSLPPGLQLDAMTGVISGTPGGGGSYPLTLLLTDANGIGDARSLTLVVLGPVPFTDFSAWALTGPAPLAVNFTDLSTNSPQSWSWSFGDGSFATAQNPTHTYTLSGDYTVSLTVNGVNGEETKTRNDYITVRGCASAPVSLATLPYASFSEPLAAYAMAQDNDLIMLQHFFFGGGLILNRDIRVTLRGGYDCVYTGNTESSVFNGSLRVQDGTVRVDRLIFR